MTDSFVSVSVDGVDASMRLFSPVLYLVSSGPCSATCSTFFSCVSCKMYALCSSNSLYEMLGELYLPRDMPEPPKESFFRGLFGGGSRQLDREELCKSYSLHTLIY